jgi:hypothetical protein
LSAKQKRCITPDKETISTVIKETPVEQITTKKIVLASVFLLALVILTAVVEIKTHFSTYIALVIMLVGTIAATRFLNGAQG